MPNWFNRKVKVRTPKMSKFDMSTDYKTSFDFGKLIPFYVEDCVPHDKFNTLGCDSFIRLAPMTFPIMHRIKVRQHFFCVPYRLVMGDKDYEKWLNNSPDIRSIRIHNCSGATLNLKNTVIDYLGYYFDLRNGESSLDGPMKVANYEYQSTSPNDGYITLPNPIAFLSLLLIWANYYADEVLHALEIDFVKSIIEDYQEDVAYNAPLDLYIRENTIFGKLLQQLSVSFTKDYFTSAAIDTQRGADVYLDSPVYSNEQSASLKNLGVTKVQSTIPQGFYSVNDLQAVNPTSHLSILDLWKKEQIMRFEEVDNIFGTRVFEKLAGHWGVISSDTRLQKPQFISGTTSVVNISEILQTSASESGSALGSYAGKGINFSRSKAVKYFVEEHSFVIGLLSVLPDNGYMQGCPRYFFKRNIFDTAIPEFNNIGYQPIYKGELFHLGNGFSNNQDLGEFGYQPRFSEYRSHPSIATGEFRDTLKSWHLCRSFANLPVLNKQFIQADDADNDRIFNNTSGVHFFADIYTRSVMTRPISYMPSSMHL